MPLFSVTFPASQDALFDVMDAFEEALSVSGYEDAASGDWFAELHFESEGEAQAGAKKANELYDVTARVEELPDVNWVERGLESLPVVEAGRFLIYGSHHDVNPRADQIPLLIDAGQAFGTGHHGTTCGCLMAIEEHLKSTSVQSALDLGCGTGILAAGFAKLSPTPILATDIDAIAVDVAKDVACDNGLKNRIRFAVGPGFETPLVKSSKPFDLVIANILARPLVMLAPQMASHVKPGGSVILSGLLIEQERRVLNAYLAQGFKFTRRYHLDEWSTLVLRK